MIFDDRIDAGRQLLAHLGDYRDRHAVVLALPRGGVPVAAEVARGLGAEFDLLIVRKIGLPWQPELAMGALVDAPTPIMVRNDAVIRASGVGEAEFDRVLAKETAELQRRRERYLKGRAHRNMKGRTVVVVDDGLATGMTMLAAVTAVRAQSPAEIVVAVPVAASDSLERVREVADRVVCVEATSDLGSIGQYYRSFGQLEDAEVIATLAQFSPAAKPG